VSGNWRQGISQTARRALRNRLEAVRSVLAHWLARSNAEGVVWLGEDGDGLELRIAGRKIDPEEIREIMDGTGGET